MEQRINGCWIDPEGMSLEALETWAEACQNAVTRAKEDLGVIEGEIASRHLGQVAVEEGEPTTYGVGYPD